MIVPLIQPINSWIIPFTLRLYVKLRRWFEGVLALLFGYAGYRVLTAKLQLNKQ